MSLFKDWIAKLDEKGFKKHEAIKKEKGFTWGIEDLNITVPITTNPLEFFLEYNASYISNSEVYFKPPQIPIKNFQIVQESLQFPSTIETRFKENNNAVFRYYPIRNPLGVIIVIPHWNAESEKYDKMAKLLNKLKFSALRMVLPFHGERGDNTPETSTRMVSANIGLTLLAMQQSVRDLLSCVDWLCQNRIMNIGILSSSVGSCVGFLAAAHDDRIKAFFANHMSSYFGDVVWTGVSTQHIKKSLEGRITKEDLRKCWALNSPQFFIPDLLKNNQNLKFFIMAGKYDTTFYLDLTLKIFDELDKVGFNYKRMVLPCGHYSLGNSFFKYIDAFEIGKFFIKNLKGDID